MTKKEIEELKIERIGESRKMNCGMLATIIKYINSDDIDVKFEDETIVKNKSYYHFTRGEISNPNYYKKFIGLKNTMNCGMECEIVRWGYCDDIDVIFSDGTLVKNKSYSKFQNKSIGNPNYLTQQDKRTDLSGQRIGKLKIENFDHKEFCDRQNKYYYNCKCECGNYIIMDSNYLRSCKKNNYMCSCGCAKSEARAKLNSIKQDYPFLIKYLKNKQDKNLSICSNKIIELKCPECGFEESLKVVNFIILT